MADDASNHPAEPLADVLNGAAQTQLKSIIERVERLELEKAEIAEQIKEVFAEAKGNGFDVKVLRKIVRIRKQDQAKRMEEEAITDLYLSALGDLPLFEGRTAEEPETGGIESITLTMGDGRSVSGTPDQLAAAERMVRGIPEDQALYDQAVAIVRREGKASTSFIQRRLQLGYNRAAALVELMELQGVLSAPNHSGAREILVELQA